MAVKPSQIKLEELHYYFDSREKDSLDAGSLSRKSREVLALRSRLLTLSDQEFELAMKTLNNLINSDSPKEQPKKEGFEEAYTLYQQASRD